jgi:hypothetical protein
MKGSSKGKFQFTAAENGPHKICLTPLSTGWYNARARVYLDIQYGTSEEEAPVKSDAVSRI